MASPEAFRREFPIFEKKVFLNSCSKGALSRVVEEAYAAYLESWRDAGSPWDVWVSKLEDARRGFAEHIGADADEVAVSYCASTAIGSLLSAFDFEGKRNRIVLGDFEFPTLAHNVLAQRRRGAEIVRVRAKGTGLLAASYRDATDERVKLVPVAHVCFRNGYRQDLEAVVAAAREAGAYSLVDDYQSTGTWPLDVKALGCDFLVTGTLKYLLGSSGLGFLYVSRERLSELEPLLTGWFGQERPFDFDIERASYHASARRFETGTPPVPNLYAGLAGLEVVNALDSAAVAAHIERLTSMLLAACEKRGWPVSTPEEPGRRGPLVVLECRDAEAAVSVLAQEGIVTSARGAGLRVSFHYYNLPEDVDALLGVLDAHEELLLSRERR